MSKSTKDVEAIQNLQNIDSRVKSHANDPYVVKKVTEAAKTLELVGLPNFKKK